MTAENLNNVKLKVTDLSKRYKEPPVQALKDINFEVHDGDFFCIIGPSGCGKSTTLRLIAGFEEPSEGTVLLDGHKVKDPGPDRAMVFQDLNQLFPWKTTLKNVVYPLKVNKLYSNNEHRLETGKKYLRMVGLRKFRRCLSPPAVRRDETACRHRPRPGPGPQGAAHG